MFSKFIVWNRRGFICPSNQPLSVTYMRGSCYFLYKGIDRCVTGTGHLSQLLNIWMGRAFSSSKYQWVGIFLYISTGHIYTSTCRFSLQRVMQCYCLWSFLKLISLVWSSITPLCPKSLIRITMTTVEICLCL